MTADPSSHPRPAPAPAAGAVRAALRAEALTTWRLAHGDALYRAAWLVTLGIDVALAWWAVSRLRGPAAALHTAGRLGTTLCLVLVVETTGLAAWSLLSLPRLAYGAESRAVLLHSLPLSDAARHRILIGKLFIHDLGSWVLLSVLVAGLVLWPALGLGAVPWMLATALAALPGVCYVAGALAAPRAGDGLSRTRRAVMVAVPPCATALAAAGCLWLSPMAAPGHEGLPPGTTGWMALALWAGLTALLLGPLAAPLGRLHSLSLAASGDRAKGPGEPAVPSPG